ncbi:Rrf2 family transcriptional regulator [Acinetobacter venetianus]|uniref:Rrf2 family transcriptional regulator n=1 Tax=Acinetobacter venetianus TaxID=52133 RepID=UPI000E92676C|nr:Rrf2 family transcriptional regulator [Acinetobacter venetianus]MDA0695447.1 Rrf2 family transcriptional regulator [Pseudomonadota bacterium]HBO71608.1 transcriptional regulator [Acinetobacter sp.]MCR4531380.1 Rrf2 family transcriptional regulator [Acinetobacter venetianus]MDA1253428.1 Rrf2 family transcriptional regulator [Pseudomonadota bacterium]QNH49943.1 Rrf2 family transcriptional regulator [Acinetobacter venetianus]
MRTDSKLSRMLHVLLHMARNNKTYTSDEIAQMLSTNPVVIRRTMAGLKKAGFIHSEKGPKGGWSLVEDLSKITLFDIYNAVGEPTIFAMGNERVNPDCAVERVVNAALDDAMNQAQTILLTQLKATTLADLALEFDQICTKQSFS